MDRRILTILLGGLVTGLACLVAMETAYLRWPAVLFPLLGVLGLARFAAGPMNEKEGAWVGLVAAVPLSLQFLIALPDMTENMRTASELARRDPAAYLEWRIRSAESFDTYEDKAEHALLVQDLTTLRSGTDPKAKEEIASRIREAGTQAERESSLSFALALVCPLLTFGLLGLAGGWIARKLGLKPRQVSIG